MSPVAADIVERIRVQLVRLEHLQPGEQDAIVVALVADMRARRPMAISPLGTLGPPTDPAAIRDPRETP